MRETIEEGIDTRNKHRNMIYAQVTSRRISRSEQKRIDEEEVQQRLNDQLIPSFNHSPREEVPRSPHVCIAL